MYAVIRAGGKQFRVAPGDVIKIDSAQADKSGRVQFGDVLAVSAEPGSVVKPNGGGASVTGEVLEQGRGDKIIVFKFKRKKQYKKKQGHRQAFTAVRITEIAFDGKKETAAAVARKPKKSAVDAAVEAAGTAAGAVAGVVDAVTEKKAAPKKKATTKATGKSAKKAAPKKRK